MLKNYTFGDLLLIYVEELHLWRFIVTLGEGKTKRTFGLGLIYMAPYTFGRWITSPVIYKFFNTVSIEILKFF